MSYKLHLDSITGQVLTLMSLFSHTRKMTSNDMIEGPGSNENEQSYWMRAIN